MFALAATRLAPGVIGWAKGEGAVYLTVFGTTLFGGGVFVEGYGIFKTLHFPREDALGVYRKVTLLIGELRALALILHKDYGHTPEGHRRYSRDERYKRLMQEFTQARLRCSDYGIG